MLRAFHEHGDVVRFRLGPLTAHLVAHPEDIERVLKSPRYDKETRSSAMIRELTGESILVTNGEAWKRGRRLLQPCFSPARIRGLVDLMARSTEEMLLRWEEIARGGEAIDVASEMMRLTYRIVERALFSADLPSDLGSLEESITVAIEHVYRRVESPFALPSFVPTWKNLRFRRARAEIDRRVLAVIDARRRGEDPCGEDGGKGGGRGSGERPGGDLLGVLLGARDGASGEAMTPQEVRDQAVTLLIAGHETTANALTWLWCLLARHPEAAEAARAEVDHVLGGGPLGAEALAGLEVTRSILEEALRLYPPIWAIVRRAAEADEIRGYPVPRGSHVVVSPWVTHRHPGVWKDPESFQPERFAPARLGEIPSAAHLPFGVGPRACIGAGFARQEALIIAALVLRSVRLELAPGQAVEVEPGITLRARGGLRMRLTPRRRT
jgi:cytochrome P450